MHQQGGSAGAQAASRAAMDPLLSDAIAIARVLCIFGVVYVHAWTGLDGDQLAAQAGTGQGMLRWILVEIFGRSAVPLLGMISGWLFAGSSGAQRGYGRFVAGKFRVIYLPMILWNALSILLVSGAAWFGLLLAPVPTSWWWFFDELLCLATPNDINVQTSFLRDLFICFLIAPWVLRLPRAAFGGLVALVAVWVVSTWVGPAGLPLLLRPQILLFFLFGIFARRHHLGRRVAGLPFALVAVPFLLFSLVKTAGEVVWPVWMNDHLSLVAGFDIGARIAAAALFWRLACALSGTAWGDRIKAIEPFAFMMFCAHLIMIWLLGPPLGLITGPMGSPFYPAFLLIQPFLVLGGTILLGKALVRVVPRAAAVLSGGRLRARAYAAVE